MKLKKKKIVLYFPRVFSDTRTWHGTPLTLLAISRLLADNSYDIRIVADFLFKNHIEEVVRQCRDSICLGLTCMTGFQLYDALRIASAVRISKPDLPIVWGGWHPSILPEETLEDDHVDILVQGQGERKFAEIVNRLCKNAPLDGIPGVMYKSADGTVRSTPDCTLEDINNFPSYPYDLVDVEKCLDVTEYGQRTIQYISSYGCPHRCGFCIEPIVNKRRWTGLLAERVVDDWEHLYKHYNVDSIAVYDSNFFVDKQRVYDICQGLIKKKIKIKWGNANGRIPQLVQYEPEIWQVMEKSGCSVILTGVESASQEVLDLIHKDMEIDQVKPFTELCHKYNIRIIFSYMVGLPLSESKEKNEKYVEDELKNTLQQIESMMGIEHGNRFSISIYTPYPGSDLYNRALEFGLQAPRSLVEWSRFVAFPEDSFETDTRRSWITRSQKLRVAMLTQYIFGLMYIHTRDRIASKMRNPIFRVLFLLSWNIGLLMACLRWRLRFWALPVDFWVFTQIRKYLKLF